jgi:methenyltetrahydrofolate cyclohydrolase
LLVVERFAMVNGPVIRDRGADVAGPLVGRIGNRRAEKGPRGAILRRAGGAGPPAEPEVIGKGTVQDASSAPPAAPLAGGTIAAYLDQLASAAPAPGGGSVAALTAAQGAALLGMVLNLTIDRPRFKEHDAELRAILAEAETLRAEATALLDRDATVLRALIATYKLPRATPEERAARDAALQGRTREATEVPLAGARAAAAIVPLCRRLLPIGNPTAVSDIGVAAACALAAFRSAELNVLINLGTLADAAFVAAARDELAALGAGLEEAAGAILAAVRERL